MCGYSAITLQIFDFLVIIRVFQRVNNLPPTGEIDEATLEVMNQPRCGLEDPFNKRFHKYRVMGELQTMCTGGFNIYLWLLMTEMLEFSQFHDYFSPFYVLYGAVL